MTRFLTLRFLLVALLAFAVAAPAPSFAQMKEEESEYDATDEALVFKLAKADILAWRQQGEGLESGIMLYLSTEKGIELYDITRLHVGEDLYVQISGVDAYDFLIEDPNDTYQLFLNLGDSEAAALQEYLPFNQGQIPKTRVRR